ncbi:MAG: hydroxymethylglutaryl-CoA lyase [Pseudomonadota bacterium]|nr:hydroxymethylglutaryl-CoA lyase [Pseudomonadota bacterium]
MSDVRIIDVGPRDGLQNESVAIPSAARVELINALVAAGIRTVEVGSFVSPRAVPQMARTDEVLAGVSRPPGVLYPVLVPNLRRFEEARKAGVDCVGIFAATTESFTQRNLDCSVAESLVRFGEVAKAALAQGMKVRGYVSCAVHCPFEGWVDPARTADIALSLAQMGCYEISLCDTTGAGTPAQARAMVGAVRAAIPLERLAVHFHDTYGQALANTMAALDEGIGAVDSSVAGLGGCPFAPGAAGNLATEDLLYMLEGLGVSTGVDLDRVVAAGRAITSLLGRRSPSRVAAVNTRARFSQLSV